MRLRAEHSQLRQNKHLQQTGDAVPACEMVSGPSLNRSPDSRCTKYVLHLTVTILSCRSLGLFPALLPQVAPKPTALS
jgi:hypothetical protein